MAGPYQGLRYAAHDRIHRSRRASHRWTPEAPDDHYRGNRHHRWTAQTGRHYRRCLAVYFGSWGPRSYGNAGWYPQGNGGNGGQSAPSSGGGGYPGSGRPAPPASSGGSLGGNGGFGREPRTANPDTGRPLPNKSRDNN